MEGARDAADRDFLSSRRRTGSCLMTNLKHAISGMTLQGYNTDRDALLIHFEHTRGQVGKYK